MATSLKESGKEVRIEKSSRRYLSYGENVMKIGPVDPEIIWLKSEKEEINACKIYSPSGKFVEWAKKEKKKT